MYNVEFAIGLMDMRGAKKQVINRYSDRLEKLKAREIKTASKLALSLPTLDHDKKNAADP